MSRSELNRVLTFLLAGAASGVIVAMLTCYDDHYDRVDINESVPLALFGLVVGGIASRFVRSGFWGIVVLIGTVGAVIGWLATDFKEMPRSHGMMRGAVSGTAIGAMLAATRRTAARLDSDSPSGRLNPPHA